MFFKDLLFVGVCIASAITSTAALTKGHDLSSVGIMEASEGAKWISTAGKTTTIESILGGGGMDSVRLRRLQLDVHSAMAKRFSKAGYKIYLDMHFSDTWADPTKQGTPKGWDSTSITTLSTAVKAYVTSTLRTFTSAGVNIDILSLGNEVTYGMLWPSGRVSNGDYSEFATLWKAARQGVTAAAAAGTKKPKVMIHIDNGWRYSSVSAFFKGLFATVIIANTYKKPIYIAETDWPTQCTKVTLSASYPANASGQRQWVAAIMSVLNGLSNGLGAGIFYWEPASCESALLFSANWASWPTTYATALSSVYMYA
ncbi:hypothetical protein PInf_015275 [Phytophthora infestans]|nr:hypothetical protein PInf_015275 [Phytophthora infestans]